MADVSEAQLRILLDQGHEHEMLDYKGQFDGTATRSWVELAKDVGAMQIEGGHIVFGADSGGHFTGALSERSSNLLDESAVRGKLRQYIDEPFDIRTAVHTIDGHRVGLLYVAPRADGFCIFKADGQYEVDGKTKAAFRKGDVYARHGSASEHWQQADVARIRRVLNRRADDADREHINSVAVPFTYYLASEASMLLHLVGFHGETRVSRADVERLCEGLVSTNPAPQVGSERYANWWGFLKAWRRRSTEAIAQLLKLSPFLEPEHVALVTKIDRCEYFRLLDDVAPTGNGNLSWLSNSMWEYVERVDRLGEYLVRLTNRRTLGSGASPP